VRRLHLFALRVFRRLPVRLRRRIVRTLAPSFTVGSICVIERADAAVLLVHQSYRNRWGIPGGLLQRGETPEDGARREVLEEVGLRIELVGEPAVVVAPAPHRVDVVYRARLAPGEDPVAARPCSPEILEVGWFATDALPDLQAETTSALEALSFRATTRGDAGAPNRGAAAS
jgi:8-oxo-dGTP diphosphatase